MPSPSRPPAGATNDNLPALYFYQRRGYRLTDLVPGSVITHTREQHVGFAGVPVRDEIRLEKRLEVLRGAS